MVFKAKLYGLKLVKGKDTWGEITEKPDKFPGVLSEWSHTDTLNSLSNDI